MCRDFLKFAVFPVLILFAGASTAAATTVSLVAVANTSILSAYPDNNFGASLIETGSNGVGQPGRGLIQWDLSSIPANANITDAYITMQVVKVPPGDQHAGPSGSDFNLYAMQVPWVAGTGSGVKGALATLGETTWNEELHGIASWQAGGGGIGADFASMPSASAYIGTDLGPITLEPLPQMFLDLKKWIADPYTNYGYMMVSDGEDTAGTARRFDSIQSAGPYDLPPTLSVTYTIPDAPEPDSGVLIAVTACFAVTVPRRRMAR